METPEKVSGVLEHLKKKELWLCFLAIFLGGASECTMAQWSSSYLEKAIGLPKIWGDVFGVALFSMALGLGRTLYAKYGKNAEKILFLGAIGATGNVTGPHLHFEIRVNGNYVDPEPYIGV